MSEQDPPDKNEDDVRPVRGPQDADTEDIDSRRKTQRERTLGIVVVGVIAVVALFAFIIYPRFIQPPATTNSRQYARWDGSGSARALQPLA